MAAQEMGEFVGHHAPHRCRIMALHQKKGAIEADQALGIGAGTGGAQQVGQAVHLPLQRAGDVVRGAMAPGLTGAVRVLPGRGPGAEPHLAGPVGRRFAGLQGEADRGGADPVGPQQAIGLPLQLGQFRWRGAGAAAAQHQGQAKQARPPGAAPSGLGRTAPQGLRVQWST
jgi:hypothetical protein